MNISAIGALALRVCHYILSIVLSPFGYGKELAILCLVIWLGSIAVSTAAKSWSPSDDPQLAAATGQAAIVRVIAYPQGNLTCLFQDFSHVVALDNATGEVVFSHEALGMRRFELGCDQEGWGFLTTYDENRLKWWHSSMGLIELPAPESLPDFHDITMSRTARTITGYCGGKLTTWQLTSRGEMLRTEGTLPPRTDRIFLSPDGRTLAVRSTANEIAFHCAADGSQLSQPLAMDSLVTCTVWSADSDWFAAGIEGSQVEIIRLADPERVNRTIKLSTMPTAVVVSNDGRWLVVAMASGEIEGWCEGVRVWSDSTCVKFARAMDISADNQQVIVGSLDGRLLTFAMATGTLIDSRYAMKAD